MPRKPKETESPVSRFLKAISPERLDRIEAKLEQANDTIANLAEQHATFHRDMRAAIMVQQEQIAEIRSTQAESARQVAALAKTATTHDKALTFLEKQLQAYLNRIPPQ